MIDPHLLASLDNKLRKSLAGMPPHLITQMYSWGREKFMELLINDDVPKYTPPKSLERRLWGLTFRSPLMNAAGMFKNGDGYHLCQNQGAAGYLAGTATANPRTGNLKEGIAKPFLPYARSQSASNWLGLPNIGDEAIAGKFERLPKTMPAGISIMGDPTLEGLMQTERLVCAIHMFHQYGADFIELNESCPNTEHSLSGVANRLKYISEERRGADIPIIVKFSVDTPLEAVPGTVRMLLDLGYDGVNFGNTSTDYKECRKQIKPRERRHFDYFTSTFKGGISGLPLRQKSLKLCELAVKAAKDSSHEFHVIRTGGIMDARDLKDSENAGVALNMWFTGYFEAFSKDGHRLYREVYSCFPRALPRYGSKGYSPSRP